MDVRRSVSAPQLQGRRTSISTPLTAAPPAVEYEDEETDGLEEEENPNMELFAAGRLTITSMEREAELAAEGSIEVTVHDEKDAAKKRAVQEGQALHTADAQFLGGHTGDAH